jgi:hypothetical protein
MAVARRGLGGICVDREIDAITRYRALVKKLLVPAAIIASHGLLVTWGAGLLRPSLKRSAIRTAVVDEGLVDATLSATGTVVPQTEQARSKLALENTLSELSAQFEIKKLQLESARLEHGRRKQIFDEGLTSSEDLRRAEVAERQAGIELQRIEASCCWRA